MRRRIFTILGIMTLGGVFVTGCFGQPSSTAQTNNNVNAGTTQNTSDTTNQTTNNNNTTDKQTVTNNNQTKSQISEEEAKQIALKHAGVQESDITAIQVKKDIDDGISLYEVEFYTSNKEYGYDIKMEDGTVLKADFEVLGNAGVRNEDQNQMTEEEAQNIILKQIKGATKDMIAMHLDTDDGMLFYEGKVVYNGTEYEFELNAYTGDIIKWEEEAIH